MTLPGETQFLLHHGLQPDLRIGGYPPDHYLRFFPMEPPLPEDISYLRPFIFRGRPHLSLLRLFLPGIEFGEGLLGEVGPQAHGDGSCQYLGKASDDYNLTGGHRPEDPGYEPQGLYHAVVNAKDHFPYKLALGTVPALTLGRLPLKGD